LGGTTQGIDTGKHRQHWGNGRNLMSNKDRHRTITYTSQTDHRFPRSIGRQKIRKLRRALCENDTSPPPQTRETQNAASQRVGPVERKRQGAKNVKANPEQVLLRVKDPKTEKNPPHPRWAHPAPGADKPTCLGNRNKPDHTPPTTTIPCNWTHPPSTKKKTPGECERTDPVGSSDP